MSQLPACMNMVEIDISQIAPVVEQKVDSIFREPVSKKKRETVITVEGQVNYGSKKKEARDITQTGDRENSFGWLVFRKCDLEDAGIFLKKGDRILRIASQVVDHLIDEVRPESVLEGDFLLLYAMFTINREERESIV